jgi:drug/metabolite transporter (DMT)-like permease
LVTLGVSLGLAASVAYAFYAAFTERLQASAAFSLAVVATLLLPGETGTTNQVLLLLPLIWWLSDPGRRRWVIGLVLAVLLAGPWLLFLGTIRGDLEHPMTVIPLPLATLLLLFWQARSKAPRQLVAAASQTAGQTENR